MATDCNLHVEPSGAQRWVQQPVIHGTSRALGLGSFALASPANPREQDRGLNAWTVRGSFPWVPGYDVGSNGQHRRATYESSGARCRSSTDMDYDSRRALDLLKRGTGQQDARFRDGQEEAIRHLVEGRRRQLLVQKTGWGKSLVYFITTRLLREAGLGPTFLESPLLALMRNQIAATERMGVRAETINSDNQDEWDRVGAGGPRGRGGHWAWDSTSLTWRSSSTTRRPGSVVSYYQQVGRAGRALEAARGVLLSGGEDAEITSYFIRSAFPTRNEAEQVLAALEADDDGLTQRQIEAKVNVSAGRIQKTLQLLSLESPAPIVKQGPSWQLTAASLSDAFWERAERLTVLRREEQADMQKYVQLSSDHMAFLIRALDGDPRGISPPPLPPLPASSSPEIMTEAVTFLRRSSRPVEPRRQWPPGTRIDPAHRAQPGRVLCVWNDAGWGELVSRGKLRDGRFSNELVNACAALVREWRPDPSPTWVAAVPSLRHPDLVPDFARRLADALDLPFSDVLKKTGGRPEQKTMENSDRQARNVLGSLGVAKEAILAGPVLLVDDVVDSRWTFTVAAWELRRRECGPVLPLALANAGGRS